MYTLISSNENKLIEFKRLGLSNLRIEKGKDLMEVEADPFTVIMYKAKDAGINRIVEDTSLHIDGVDIGTNIRWQLDTVREYHGRKATWEVYLGLNDGKSIKVFKGEIKGNITSDNLEPGSFGFDCYFKPINSALTLYQLELEGRKDDFSARKNAISKLLLDIPYKEIIISEIPEWIGKYQK